MDEISKKEIIKAIEQDNLPNFITHSQASSWREALTSIASPALDVYPPTLETANSLQYAVHCKANNIFNYLLHQSDMDVNIHHHKQSNNGSSVLEIALHSKHYQYAQQIILHSSFNPYESANICALSAHQIARDSQAYRDYEKTIGFYLDKIKAVDFEQNDSLKFRILMMIGNGKESYEWVNKKYEGLCERDHYPRRCVLDFYKEPPLINWLTKVTFKNGFQQHLANELSSKDIDTILSQTTEDSSVMEVMFNKKTQQEIATTLDWLSCCPQKLLDAFHHDLQWLTHLNRENLQNLVNLGLLLENEHLAFKHADNEGFMDKEKDAICAVEWIATMEFNAHTPSTAYEVLTYIVENHHEKLMEIIRLKNINVLQYPVLRATMEVLHLERNLDNANDKNTRRKKI